MSKTVHVNISTLVNASKIRKEKRDGRDVIIVPSATLPDNQIMNKIRYPAAVIAESFKSLEGKPAPLGHPVVNGMFVSASSPDGIIRGFIGAHNERVRRENGRVYVDKVIDVQFANQSEGGRRVLEAIEDQEPIHTSTGLLATISPLANSEDGAEFEVETMVLDHDAILLDEAGAATPDQGVGMFVNASGEQIPVINSYLGDEVDREMDWALESLLRVAERKERLPLLERMKAAIDTIIRGSPEPETVANQETSPMDKEQFDALSGKVEALSATVAGLPEVLANALKPVIEAQEAIANAAKAKEEAEHAALVNQVVEAKLLDEATAKATPAATLTVLANSLIQTPKVALRVNARMADASGGDRKPLALKSED